MPNSRTADDTKLKNTVSTFLEQSLNRKQLEKYDSSANLWFRVYEVASLLLAILQIENFAWKVNFGIVNFLVFGILLVAYELAKHQERIDLVIAAFGYLRWYTFMLGSVLLSFGVWYVLYLWLLPAIPTFTQLAVPVLLGLCIASFVIVSHFMIRVDKHYRRLLDADDEVISITHHFAPRGLLVRSSLFLLNLMVVITTFGGVTLFETFLETFLGNPLLWTILLSGFLVILPISFRMNTQEQVDRITTYQSGNEPTD